MAPRFDDLFEEDWHRQVHGVPEIRPDDKSEENPTEPEDLDPEYLSSLHEPRIQPI